MKELTDETRQELQDAVKEDFSEIQVIADTLDKCYREAGKEFTDFQIAQLAMQYYSYYNDAAGVDEEEDY